MVLKTRNEIRAGYHHRQSRKLPAKRAANHRKHQLCSACAKLAAATATAGDGRAWLRVCWDIHLSCLFGPASALCSSPPFPWTKRSTSDPLLHDEKAHLHMQQHGALNSPLQNSCLTSVCLLYLDDVSRQRFLSVCMEGPHSSHLTRPQMVSYLKADIFRLGVNYPL